MKPQILLELMEAIDQLQDRADLENIARWLRDIAEGAEARARALPPDVNEFIIPNATERIQ